MPNYSPKLTLEGSFSHAQLRELSEQYPRYPLSITSAEGTAPFSALENTYTNSRGKTINPSWYELYPLESGVILPLVTKSLLKRGYNELYEKESNVPSKVWNAIQFQRIVSAGFIHTLPIMKRRGSGVASRQLMGIRADQMDEFVGRIDELGIYNLQNPRSQSRKFIAAYANNLLALSNQ